MTKKRKWDIISRQCIDGSPQKECIKWEDAAAPTVVVVTDLVLITSAVGAHKRWDMVTIDLPGAHLDTNLTEEWVIMRPRKWLCKLLKAFNPLIYMPYVMVGKNGDPILNVHLQTALYSPLCFRLLFFLKLFGKLEACGFKLNPYDLCVSNMIVSGSQMMVTWHIDDPKFSHKDLF